MSETINLSAYIINPKQIHTLTYRALKNPRNIAFQIKMDNPIFNNLLDIPLKKSIYIKYDNDLTFRIYNSHLYPNYYSIFCKDKDMKKISNILL